MFGRGGGGQWRSQNRGGGCGGGGGQWRSQNRGGGGGGGGQWRSQNRVVAWAQVGQHIYCWALCGGGLWVRTSEIPSAGFSGQVSVAKIIHISSIQEALLLLFSLFLLSIADTFAHSANLKLRQANARAKGKVARARARVCRGLATLLEGGRMWRANLKEEGGREVKVRGRGGRREGGEGERQGRKEGGR